MTAEVFQHNQQLLIFSFSSYQAEQLSSETIDGLYQIPSYGHSFIHSGYFHSAPSRNLLRGTPSPLSPATAKEKCLKKLAEGRHIVHKVAY